MPRALRAISEAGAAAYVLDSAVDQPSADPSPDAVCSPEGGQRCGSDNNPARPRRTWVASAGELTQGFEPLTSFLRAREAASRFDARADTGALRNARQ